MELNRLKTDHKKATEGVWVKFLDGVRFLVAKKPNSKFDEELAKLIEPHLSSIAAGTFDDALDKLITIKAVAKTVLLDWEGITVDGEPYKYSPENCLEMLGDPDFADVYRFVLTMAHSSERYRVVNLEDAEKN